MWPATCVIILMVRFQHLLVGYKMIMTELWASWRPTRTVFCIEANCFDPYSLKVKRPSIPKLMDEALLESAVLSIARRCVTVCTGPVPRLISLPHECLYCPVQDQMGNTWYPNCQLSIFLISVLWGAELLEILLWRLAKRPQVRYINSKLSSIKYQPVLAMIL